MEEKGTIQCPNRLCGKIVSTEFEKCPFCGTKLSKLSVEEVLADFSEKENNKKNVQKEKVLNYFHIKGDVSDEQFEELNKKYNQINNKVQIPFFTSDAEAILNKYARWLKRAGLIGLILCVFFAILSIIINAAVGAPALYFIISPLLCVIVGILCYITCIIIKAFIDVFVNISVTLQDINTKIENLHHNP